MVSKQAQRDGWGALISRYGRRVSPSASRGEGELTSAGRLEFLTLYKILRDKTPIYCFMQIIFYGESFR